MTLSRRAMLGAALALPAATAFADNGWPGALVMGTGRPGGYYTSYGTAWGRLAAQATGVDIAFRASGGAAADILLIEQNAAQLGMTTATVAEQARNGTGNWTAGVKFQSFRALFPMFPSTLQIVSPRNTGITTLAGLAGRRLGTGPDGGSGAAAIPGILASIGVLPDQTIPGDYEAQMRAMLAGALDACAFLGAPPIPAIAAIADHEKLSLIGFSDAEAAQVARTQPGMTAMMLAAGTFPGQSVTVGSVGTANIAIGTADLPDALAQAITLAALRNRPILAAIVPAAGTTLTPATTLQSGITYHPGAAAALRSYGLDVPVSAVAG